MNRYKEYAIVTGILFLVIAFIYYKFLGGQYILSSGDSLSAQAVKHSLNNVEITGWYSYLFSGMPAVHSLISSISQLMAFMQLCFSPIRISIK